jgi:diguanylate cyclase (GGDEF)-like protein
VSSEQQDGIPNQVSRTLVAAFLALAAASMLVGGLESHKDAAWTATLLAVVAGVCLTRPRYDLPAGGVAAAGFAAFLLGHHLESHARGSLGLCVSIGLTSLTLLLLPLSVRMLTRRFGRALADSKQAQTESTDSSPQDEATGAYRRSYLNRLLEEEVERGRRSKRSFTVCLVGLDDWRRTVEELGPADADRRMKSAIASIGDSKRLLDKVVDLGEGEVLLVLAETPLGGAETVAWRLRAQFSEHLSASVRVGIAEFPRDAVTEAGLMEEVGQALAFARTANIPVVDRSLLSAEQTPAPH